MIITGFQGIGKSSVSKQHKSIIDLESSMFWKNNPDGTKSRPEDWYVYYIQMAVDLSKQGYIVFVSCHEPVRKYLIENHENETICLIYPSPSIKDDWLKRLKIRYECSESDKDKAAYEFAKNNYDVSIELLQAEDYCYDAVKELDTITYDLNTLILDLLNEVGA